jgi:hypothetical protein
MSTQPAVSDNTLATAPALHLKRHSVFAVTPLGKGEKKEETVHETELTSNIPQEPGVSVADLLAKRAEVEQPEEDIAPHTLQTAEPAPAELTKAEPAKPEPAEDLAKKPIEDKPAAQSDQQDATVDHDKASETNKDQKDDQNIEDDESLAKVLQSDESPSKRGEQSESLKEAAKELNEEDGRPHYELYGGKPVIVVHKGSGSMPAVMWILWFFVCVLLAVVIVDVLLDAGIITTTYEVPYTNFIKD